MDTQTVVFLVIGVVIVIGVGRLLALSGRQYLSSSAPGAPNARANAGSAAMLVAVLFHLISLGLLAFISVLPIGHTPVQTTMLRIGITLIVIGIIYAVSLSLLRSRREDAMVAEVEAEQHQQFTPRPRDGAARTEDAPAGLRTGPNPRVRTAPRPEDPAERPPATGPGGEEVSPIERTGDDPRFVARAGEDRG